MSIRLTTLIFPEHSKMLSSANFHPETVDIDNHMCWKSSSLFLLGIPSEAPIGLFAVTYKHARWSSFKLHFEGFQVHFEEYKHAKTLQTNTNKPSRESHNPNPEAHNILWKYYRPVLFSTVLCGTGLFSPVFWNLFLFTTKQPKSAEKKFPYLNHICSFISACFPQCLMLP